MNFRNVSYMIRKKQEYCQKNNINLIYINYNDNIIKKLQELYTTVWNI